VGHDPTPWRLRAGHPGEPEKNELVDSDFAVRAAKDAKALFGKAPKAYAYDRAGWSEANVAELKKLGVREVGLAPRGKAKWQVEGKVKDKLVSERAQVEGCIGSVKSRKYGFNKPAAKSAAGMGVCGQRSVLGFNLNKLMNGFGGATKGGTGRVIRCGLLQTKPPAAKFRSPRKTNACSFGKMPPRAARISGQALR